MKSFVLKSSSTTAVVNINANESLREGVIQSYEYSGVVDIKYNNGYGFDGARIERNDFLVLNEIFDKYGHSMSLSILQTV